MSERSAERLVVGLFAVTLVSGVALLAVYVLGGQTQLEGVLLAVCLGSLGFGILAWAHRLMPGREVAEPRHALASTDRERRELDAAIEEEGDFTRRRVLVGMLLAAFGGLAAALAVPVFSLGPAPGRELFETPWKPGLRLVNGLGEPIHADELGIDSIITAFPEGFPGSPDGQTVLIRVPPETLQLPDDRQAGAPDGYVAYSKVCTHAGCPVGLYRTEERQLVCPCHQSTFDVLTGAVPVYGPAARPLPQLPIRLEADGTFTAIDGFSEPVGPSFWNVHS